MDFLDIKANGNIYFNIRSISLNSAQRPKLSERESQQKYKDLYGNPDKRPEKIILRKNSQSKSLTLLPLWIASFLCYFCYILLFICLFKHVEVLAAIQLMWTCYTHPPIYTQRTATTPVLNRAQPTEPPVRGDPN